MSLFHCLQKSQKDVYTTGHTLQISDTYIKYFDYSHSSFSSIILLKCYSTILEISPSCFHVVDIVLLVDDPMSSIEIDHIDVALNIGMWSPN